MFGSGPAINSLFSQMEPGSPLVIKSIGADLTETAFRLGIITVNEFRQCVGFEPKPGGDVVFDMRSFSDYWGGNSGNS